MRLPGPVGRVLLVLLAMVLAAPATAVPTAAAAQDDASRFAEQLAARDASSILAGPFFGELVQDDGFSVTTGAGLAVEDFSASATFLNPLDETDTPWDFGFTFHRAGESAQQVLIDSTGLWHYSPFPEGTLESGFVPAFDAAPGGENTIDLIVDGDTALLGVNGEFLTTIALPPAATSDVQIGSGFFTSTTVDGRPIPYLEFAVWSLPGAELPEPTATPEPTFAAEPAPTVSPDDAAAFAMLLASQSQAVPLAGPFNANLTEEEGRIALSWANVDLADFHARATFAVPETASNVPWDIGFMVRASPAGTMRVAVDSGGNWYFAVGAASPSVFGPVSGLITTPGGTNTLDLIVAAETAVLGVNGEFAAVIDLPAASAAGDVAVGSAFFTDQTLPERVTQFGNFVVLPFNPDAVSAAESPPAAADAFASLLAETAQIAPLAGPFAGRLVESTPGSAALAPAGVALSDFGAAATFFTPVDVVDGLWGAGFQFRGDADVTHRIVLGFNGDVYAVLPGESPRIVGTAATFDATPGAANALHLFVEEGRALVGVNGEFVSAVDLAEAPIAADVLVGAAFFDEDFVQGRVTEYEDFEVWEIA